MIVFFVGGRAAWTMSTWPVNHFHLDFFCLVLVFHGWSEFLGDEFSSLTQCVESDVLTIDYLCEINVYCSQSVMGSGLCSTCARVNIDGSSVDAQKIEARKHFRVLLQSRFRSFASRYWTMHYHCIVEQLSFRFPSSRKCGSNFFFVEWETCKGHVR